MIDFHCHLLPGIDDGPHNVSDSIVMAARLAEFGWQTVCCTPHCIKGYYDHTPQQVREATRLLQADLDNAGIRLELWPGMEYMLDECFAGFAEHLQPLGNTRLVLCEAPQQANPYIVVEGLQRILAAGFVPLIAHPERTEYFHNILTRKPEPPAKSLDAESAEETFPPQQSPRPLWKKLLHIGRNNSKFKMQNSKFKIQNSEAPPAEEAQRLPVGCLFQANLGSFTGFYGETVQRRAYQLLKSGVYSCVATDLHDSQSSAGVLVRDKYETNPLLQKLAGFDGVVGERGHAGRQGQGEFDNNSRLE